MSNIGTSVKVAIDSSDAVASAKNIKTMATRLMIVKDHVSSVNSEFSITSAVIGLITWRTTALIAGSALLSKGFGSASVAVRNAADGAGDLQSAINDVDRMPLLLAAGAIGEIDDKLARNANERAAHLAGMTLFWEQMQLAIDNVNTSITKALTPTPDTFESLTKDVEKFEKAIEKAKKNLGFKPGEALAANQKWLEEAQDKLSKMADEAQAEQLRREAFGHEQRLSSLGRFLSRAERQELTAAARIASLRAELLTEPSKNRREALEVSLKLEGERERRAQEELEREKIELQKATDDEITKLKLEAIKDSTTRELAIVKQQSQDLIDEWYARAAAEEVTFEEAREATNAILLKAENDRDAILERESEKAKLRHLELASAMDASTRSMLGLIKGSFSELDQLYTLTNQLIELMQKLEMLDSSGGIWGLFGDIGSWGGFGNSSGSSTYNGSSIGSLTVNVTGGSNPMSAQQSVMSGVSMALSQNIQTEISRQQRHGGALVSQVTI